MKQKLIAIELFGCIAFFCIFTALALTAFFEKSVSYGGGKPYGVVHAEGSSAVIAGIFFLAIAAGSVAYAVRYTRYKAVYWLMLFCTWVGIAAWQFSRYF